MRPYGEDQDQKISLYKYIGLLMAINVLQVKPISRGAGQSATACAAYRSGEKIYDQREDREHDYSRKTGIDNNASQIIIPDGITSPVAQDRATLWNAAEAAEMRKDARVAREYIIALPKEASPEERQQLAEAFGRLIANRYSVAVDLNIHSPHRDADGTDNGNHHAHLLSTTRQLTPEGLGKKSDIELSDSDRAKRGLSKGKDEVFELRVEWTALQNRVLEKYGIQLSAHSLADQGIDQQPTLHMGARDTALERQGIATYTGNQNRIIQAENAERTAQKHQIKELDQEIQYTTNGIGELQQQRTTTHNDLRLLQQLAHQFSSTQAQIPQPEKTTERTLTNDKTARTPNPPAKGYDRERGFDR
jgi:hypothetical protein